jgi:hypothetical protein
MLIISLALIEFKKININPWLEDTTTLLKWIDLFNSNEATYPPSTLFIFGKFLSFGVDVQTIQISYFIITYLIISKLFYQFIGNWVIIFLLICFNPGFNNLNSYLVALQPINFMIVIFLILQFDVVLKNPIGKTRIFSIFYYFSILILGYMTSPHIMISIVAVIFIQLICLLYWRKNFLYIFKLFVFNILGVGLSILLWINYLGSAKTSFNTFLLNASANGSDEENTIINATLEQLKLFFSLKIDTFYFFQNPIFVIINIFFFLFTIILLSRSNQFDLLKLTCLIFVFQIIIISGFVQFNEYKGRLGYIYLVFYAFYLTYLIKTLWEHNSVRPNIKRILKY